MKKDYLDLILYKIGQNRKKQSLNCEISIRIVKSIAFSFSKTIFHMNE